MPQIPTLSGNRVSPGTLPSPRIRQPATGGIEALGDAISNVGSVLNQVRREERLKADRAAVTEADRQLSEAENSLLFDPQAGAYTRRGKNAFGIAQQILPEYQKAASKIEQGLKNDRQKLIFREALNDRVSRISRDLGQHEARERESYYDETDQSALMASAQSAANYAGRPDRIDQELSLQRSIVDGLAQRKGWDQAKKDGFLRATETQTHEAVVSRFLLDNRFDEAGRYLAERSPRMLDQKVMELQRRIILEEEQAFSRKERERKRVGDEVTKEGDRLLRDGSLSASWLERNRAILDVEDYRYFSKKLSGDDDSSGPRDTTLYADLRLRAGGGEDIRQEAREALRRGDIRSSDFDRIIGEVETQKPGWYQRGKDFIENAAAPSAFTMDPAPKARMALMLDEWYEWAQANPKAGEAEAKQAYTEIVAARSLVDMTELARKTGLRVRDLAELEKKEAELVRKLQSGEITREQAEQQAQVLQEARARLQGQP